MNATKIAIVIVIIIAIAGAAYIFTRPQTTESPVNTESEQESMQNQMNDEPMESDNENMMESEEEDEVASGEVIELTATNYQFSQEIIEVEVGEEVTIELTSNEGMHDWVVDQFNAGTQVINPGETTTVTFTPTETGEFEYYCSVGNHRELGMVGTLVVTE